MTLTLLCKTLLALIALCLAWSAWSPRRRETRIASRGDRNYDVEA